MTVTGIRALLEAAEYIKKEEIAKSLELSNNSICNENDKYTSKVSENDLHQENSASFDEKTSGQDREAHNRLEKDRRADLKARFERLQNLVPATKGKKCSNLSILRNASRYILSQTRLERESVIRVQHLSHEKSQLDKSVERAWQRLSILGVDLARVRRKVRSKLAQREKREESSKEQDILDDTEHDGDKARCFMKLGKYDSLDDNENRSRSASPSGSHLIAGSAGISSLSDDDDEGSESTTTASECGSNGIECGEITDEASECGEVVVQEGIVPSQAHTSVTLCPTPLSPQLQETTNGENVAATSASFQLKYATSCNMSGSFTSTASGLSVGGCEPQSGTSSDSGFSSGVNDEPNGEVKLPMKKRKLARSLVQDLTSATAQDAMSIIKDASTADTREGTQPPEKKLALSTSNARWLKNVSPLESSKNEASDKHISLITTLPSVTSCSQTSLSSTNISSNVGLSSATSLSSSMPLLQRTLTDPRTPPAALVRHHSFESPENLDPNWMNQRIVPVYQLLSGTQNASPPSAPMSAPGSPPAQPKPNVITSALSQAMQSYLKPVSTSSNSPAIATALSCLPALGGVGVTIANTITPSAEKLSLVTHSPVNSMLKPAIESASVSPPSALVTAQSLHSHTPQFTLATPSSTTVNNGTHLVLPVIAPSDGLILRNLTSAGRHQPIVLMPITASGASHNSIINSAPSLVPIQLVSDGVLSTATVMNGKLDHT